MAATAFALDMPAASFGLEMDPSATLSPQPNWILVEYTNPDFLKSVIGQLDELRRLKRNWDGYGSPAIDKRILAAAADLAADLAKRSGIPTPAVAPMSTGNVQFEWHRGGKLLEIEIETPKRAHYLKWDPPTSIEEEDVCPLSNVDGILQLIKWFLGEVVRV